MSLPLPGPNDGGEASWDAIVFVLFPISAIKLVDAGNLAYSLFFSFFYTSIVFNPKETAENLRKYGGYIPGIRPGERSAEYIENILIKLTTIGSLYLTFVCLMPEFLISKYPIPFYLGGTSILIVVVVAMDTVTQVQTRLMSSQYESLIKKTKFGK